MIQAVLHARTIGGGEHLQHGGEDLCVGRRIARRLARPFPRRHHAGGAHTGRWSEGSSCICRRRSSPSPTGVDFMKVKPSTPDASVEAPPRTMVASTNGLPFLYKKNLYLINYLYILI